MRYIANMRDRDSWRKLHIYIHMYIERWNDKERERDRKKERGKQLDCKRKKCGERKSDSL